MVKTDCAHHFTEISYGNDQRALYLKRRADQYHERLLVSLATHNQGDKYASLEGFSKYIDADVLFLTDAHNSYYLKDDLGDAYLAFLKTIVPHYAPAKVVFFGSSMAGFASVRFAFEFDANCILNNPQFDLDVTMDHAWPELKSNIRRIPERMNIMDLPDGHRHCAIFLIHGDHPMDRANFEAFVPIWLKHPGLKLMAVHCPDLSHGYLIPKMAIFNKLYNWVLDLRETFPLAGHATA
ncbi:hypothetical protein [Methylomagnum sp.]